MSGAVASVTRSAKVTAASSLTKATPVTVANLAAPGTLPLALTATALGSGGIRIQWPNLNLDSSGQIIVFRKSVDAPNFVDDAIGQPNYDATSFTDPTAGVGSSYEYKVVVYSQLGAAPLEKFILAGNAASPISSRGSVLIVVDETQLDTTRDGAHTTLAPALKQYQTDLIDEGYNVLMLTAPRVDIPRVPPADHSLAAVAAYYAPWYSQVLTLKSRIRNVWQGTPDLKSVILLGHVAVPYSGIFNPDGSEHLGANGAWATDAFYSTLSAPDSVWSDDQEAGEGNDVNTNLPGDGKFDADTLQQLGIGTEFENAVFSDVSVGRVDFSQMNFYQGIPSNVGATATPTETLLLARYLARDHAWRTGQVDVRRLALFQEQFPFPENYDTSRLTPNVGFDGVLSGHVSPSESQTAGDVPFPANTPAANTSDLATDSWLWLYASAGGYPSRQTIHFDPTHELRSDQYVYGAESSSDDFTRANNFGPHKAVFNMIYGSYVGDWDHPEALLRAVIAESNGLGLASMWGARPNWEQHTAALGEPIGLSLQKTINNFGADEAYGYNPYEGSTRLALMGDPTLREDNLSPATNVRAATAAGGVGTTLTWTASADPTVAGYYVYRSSSPTGPFIAIDSAMHTGTTFTDPVAHLGQSYYMVRAAKLQTTPSGTYWNLALGAINAPVVTDAQFSSTSGPHTLTLTFSQDVGATLTAAGLTISGTRYDAATHTQIATTLVPGVDFAVSSYDPTTRTARIVFHVTSVSATAGQIPSGRFSLSFGAGTVANALGTPLDASYHFNFGYVQGDANGDLRVDFDDLLTLARHYGSTGVSDGTLSGDFNGDGRVDFDDLLALAKNYGVTI